jgi:holo-ACP synthase CitX
MDDQILKAREERFEHVKSISKNYPTLILLKANTPGKDKERYSSYFLINIFNNVLEDYFKITYKALKKGFDGPYYVYGIQAESIEKTKKLLIEIETSHPLGRLIDLDLYHQKQVVSREDYNLPLRKCMLCDQPALYCMKQHNHTLDELLLHIDKEILTYLNNQVSSFIKQSMLNELNLDHKF